MHKQEYEGYVFVSGCYDCSCERLLPKPDRRQCTDILEAAEDDEPADYPCHLERESKLNTISLEEILYPFRDKKVRITVEVLENE